MAGHPMDSISRQLDSDRNHNDSFVCSVYKEDNERISTGIKSNKKEVMTMLIFIR